MKLKDLIKALEYLVKNGMEKPDKIYYNSKTGIVMKFESSEKEYSLSIKDDSLSLNVKEQREVEL